MGSGSSSCKYIHICSEVVGSLVSAGWLSFAKWRGVIGDLESSMFR